MTEEKTAFFFLDVTSLFFFLPLDGGFDLSDALGGELSGYFLFCHVGHFCNGAVRTSPQPRERPLTPPAKTLFPSEVPGSGFRFRLYWGNTIQPRKRNNRLQDGILPSAKTLFPNGVPLSPPGVTDLLEKDPIPLGSLELHHIAIWRPDPMHWVQDELFSFFR
jgi:hypothetical protein